MSEYKIEIFDEISSTNTYLVEQARGQNIGKTIAIARSQTGGRGRMGRTFHSPRDAGLYMSLLLPLSGIEAADGLTMRVGVALAEAMEAQFPTLTPSLKWVNDIYIGDRKLAGILVEGVTRPDGVFCAVIGVGMNFLKSAFPDELVHRVTSVEGEDGGRHCPMDFVCPLVRAVEKWLATPFPTVIECYRSRSYLKGKPLTVLPHGKAEYTAQYLDIDGSGALLVETQDGEIQRLFTGDVSVKNHDM